MCIYIGDWVGKCVCGMFGPAGCRRGNANGPDSALGKDAKYQQWEVGKSKNLHGPHGNPKRKEAGNLKRQCAATKNYVFQTSSYQSVSTLAEFIRPNEIANVLAPDAQKKRGK